MITSTVPYRPLWKPLIEKALTKQVHVKQQIYLAYDY